VVDVCDQLSAATNPTINVINPIDRWPIFIRPSFCEPQPVTDVTGWNTPAL